MKKSNKIARKCLNMSDDVTTQIFQLKQFDFSFFLQQFYAEQRPVKKALEKIFCLQIL